MDSAQPQARRREIMSSSLRCLAALEVLARGPAGHSVSEVAAALAVNLTTAHRVLSTLSLSGFVSQDSRDRRYRIASKLLWIGTAYLRRSPVYLASFALIEELARRTQMMAHVAAWEDRALYYLHTAGPPNSQNLFSQIGERIPVHCTGLGKAVLAWQPEADVQLVLAAPLEAFTVNTATTPAAMRRELTAIRERGYAIDDEESAAGMRCVAAPVRDHSGAVTAAVGISAPCADLGDDDIPHFARLVLETAMRISLQLGYRPPAASIPVVLSGNRRRASAR